MKSTDDIISEFEKNLSIVDKEKLNELRVECTKEIREKYLIERSSNAAAYYIVERIKNCQLTKKIEFKYGNIVHLFYYIHDGFLLYPKAVINNGKLCFLYIIYYIFLLYIYFF